MEDAVLKKIGLTEGEVKVYLALLDLGQSTVGPVVKQSGVSSSKIYILLDKLIQKGLAVHVTESGKKHFKVSSPKKVFELLEKKKAEIKRQEAEFSKILPHLIERERQRAKPHEAEIYEGYNGIKTYFNSLLEEMRKGEERLVFGARSGYPVSEPAQRFFQNYNRRCATAGLRTRIIFNSDLRGSESAKAFGRMPLTEVRYLPQNTLSSVGIQKDKIDMLIWTKETAVVFVIKSAEVARTFREQFRVLWRSAKK